MKKIHLFFLEIGLGKLSENKMYLYNIDRLKYFNPDTKIIIWNELDLDTMVKDEYPELLDFWNNFPSKFYKIDFGRYLVLKLYGGMYIDLDMECINKIPDDVDFINLFFNSKDKKSFNNNVIYFKNPILYEELINFSIKRFNNNKMPITWKKRRFLYTVGARMYHKFCKDRNMINNHSYINNYLIDKQGKSWLRVEV
jgi:mannosyltransferase OCH1-like enzyme